MKARPWLMSIRLYSSRFYRSQCFVLLFFSKRKIRSNCVQTERVGKLKWEMFFQNFSSCTFFGISLSKKFLFKLSFVYNFIQPKVKFWNMLAKELRHTTKKISKQNAKAYFKIWVNSKLSDKILVTTIFSSLH